MPPLSRLPSPLCTKLVTFTVYTWVAVSTVSSQNALTEVRTDFPFFTVLQMISYVGALRVGQVRRGGERRQRRRRGRRGERRRRRRRRKRRSKRHEKERQRRSRRGEDPCDHPVVAVRCVFPNSWYSFFLHT